MSFNIYHKLNKSPEPRFSDLNCQKFCIERGDRLFQSVQYGGWLAGSAISVDGGIYTWGYGAQGMSNSQKGAGVFSNGENSLGTKAAAAFFANSWLRPISNAPPLDESSTRLRNDKVIKHGGGNYVRYALTEQGYVYVNGNMSNGNQAFNAAPQGQGATTPITEDRFIAVRFGGGASSTSASTSLMKDVVFGSAAITNTNAVSCAAVSKNGQELWVWGNWGTIRFNTGADFNDVSTPINVFGNYSGFTGKTIKKIVTSGWSSLLVLMTDGTLHGLGNNGTGLLGTGGTASQSNFIQIASNVVDVTCPYVLEDSQTTGRVVYLDTSDRLWMAGLNAGTFGDGTQTNRATFYQVASNVDRCWVGVACTFYLTKSNQWFVSGGAGGACQGLGDTLARTTYVRHTSLESIVASGGGFSYFHTQAHNTHDATFIVLNDGRSFACGTNSAGALGVRGQGTFQTTFSQITSPEPLVYIFPQFGVIPGNPYAFTQGRATYALGRSGRLYETGENKFFMSYNPEYDNSADTNISTFMPVQFSYTHN